MHLHATSNMNVIHAGLTVRVDRSPTKPISSPTNTSPALFSNIDVRPQLQMFCFRSSVPSSTLSPDPECFLLTSGFHLRLEFPTWHHHQTFWQQVIHHHDKQVSKIYSSRGTPYGKVPEYFRQVRLVLHMYIHNVVIAFLHCSNVLQIPMPNTYWIQRDLQISLPFLHSSLDVSFPSLHNPRCCRDLTTFQNRQSRTCHDHRILMAPFQMFPK